MLAAPRATPDHPNSPNRPVFSGMNGLQFASAICGFLQRNAAARIMKMITVATLINTTATLTLADSRTPMTRIDVTRQIARKAVRLKMAVTCGSESVLTPAASNAGVIDASNTHRPWKKYNSTPGVWLRRGGQ